MDSILNTNQFNDDLLSQIDGSSPENQIHIRVRQRNARKCTTTIENLPDNINVTEFIKIVKKKFCCNGAKIKDKKTDTEFIQFQGDHRENLLKVLNI